MLTFLNGALGHVFFLKNDFWKIIFQIFLCLFAIRKVDQRKTLSSQRKIWLGFQESVFLENLGGKHFPKVVKNLEKSYYLLIISNLVLKLLITIYIYILFWIFIFQFHLLKFNFYINFGPHFYNCYLLFPYHFLIEIFYLSNLILILLIVTYFIWNNLWNVNYYYFNYFLWNTRYDNYNNVAMLAFLNGALGHVFFFEKWFLKNYFLNFSVFVCH